MAILIQINKLDEFPEAVIYEFGPAEGVIGQVALYKGDGRVELLDMQPSAVGRQGFYLPRVRRVLTRHHAAGEYPARTSYRA